MTTDTMAVKTNENQFGDKWFRCVKCGYDEILSEHKYCSECGRKIIKFIDGDKNDRT